MILTIGSIATREDALRAQPATLLYTFKSPDSLSQEQEAASSGSAASVPRSSVAASESRLCWALEVIDVEDEMEALDTLAAWLRENCERRGAGDRFTGGYSYLLPGACQATAPGSFGRTPQRSPLEPLCCCKHRRSRSTELVSHRPALSRKIRFL